MNLQPYIQDIPDFPKKDIIFKDITPLFKNQQAFQSAVEQLIAICPEPGSIDKVIGIESRGFIMGSIIANRLNAGFVPVRKQGKLPAEVISQKYDLEYGSAILEIHKDAIQEGERVLIHDDVLATGGTAKATQALIEKLGGTVVQFNFLIELVFLKGREGLNAPVGTLLTY
ncbi:adenine phosphoribosyltransferase [Aquimarina sp. ERC-38]|uniref:adenine phosphoribosyltransferase n=1 Tax=Aquimarina sp. ERC-38 TaxID=2949996 RepID=UPI0022481961|nr:adenine phosphoribosyltransferase [Aquimarina sp. ERC-38]UZO80606.1 adenine phosphoribosyltransferase [Aquimarina sp. ERC-38]